MIEPLESELHMPISQTKVKCSEGGYCETDWNTSFRYCIKCGEDTEGTTP